MLAGRSGGTDMRRMKTVLMAAVLGTAAQAAWAETAAALFREADVELGKRLIAQHRCTECHREKVGGDGSAMYRPGRRITTAGLLRGMVEQCNTELNLGMFPEEVTSVAAVLNRDHYRFK